MRGSGGCNAQLRSIHERVADSYGPSFPGVFCISSDKRRYPLQGREVRLAGFAYKPSASHSPFVQGTIPPGYEVHRRSSTTGAMVLDGVYRCNLVCALLFGPRVLNFIKDFLPLLDQGFAACRGPRSRAVLRRVRETACDLPAVSAGPGFRHRTCCAGLERRPMRGRKPPHRWRAIRPGPEKPRRRQ